MKKPLLLLTYLLTLLPVSAHAWWNDDWSFRKQLTLDTSAAGGDIKGNLDNFPVLVRLHSGNFNYFLDLKKNGADLRFIAGDDKTPLKYHVEKLDPINDIALIWVKVPKLAGSSNQNKIWMYYGNSAAVAAQDAAGTYEVHQALDYHLDNKKGLPKDQTAYGNQPSQYTAKTVPTGLIGGGAKFDAGQRLQIPASPSLTMKPDSGWTLSAWVKIAGPQKDAYLVERHDAGQALTVGIDGTAVYAELSDGAGKVRTPAGAALTPGHWHHLAVVLGNGALSLYIDGRQASTVTAALKGMSGDIVLGGAAGGGHDFTGDVDEVEVASVARSADWIKAASGDEGVDSKFIAYGSDEQADAGGGSSILPVILHSVTIDGWVVIVLLTAMAAVSWVVMLFKGLIIRRVQRDNRRFLEQFRNLKGTETARLDREETPEERELEDIPLLNALSGKHDHFQSSPIYRIYHRGIRELRQRVGTAVGAQATGLTAKGLNAMRATLDAVLVRENQKINAQMVLLTIAISGGPFLGLLGTVMGVMITFANIAASGDVNINAIAPGISAALVATVAGLLVAIPALFGYNYLASRIKNISSDMHVFVDEFISKAEEQYGE